MGESAESAEPEEGRGGVEWGKANDGDGDEQWEAETVDRWQHTINQEMMIYPLGVGVLTSQQLTPREDGGGDVIVDRVVVVMQVPCEVHDHDDPASDGHPVDLPFSMSDYEARRLAAHILLVTENRQRERYRAALDMGLIPAEDSPAVAFRRALAAEMEANKRDGE